MSHIFLLMVQVKKDYIKDDFINKKRYSSKRSNIAAMKLTICCGRTPQGCVD